MPKQLRQLSREDWIKAALGLLIRVGIDAVKVEPLARKLHVTPGSFYWHFRNRRDLHDALLTYWEDTNTQSFRRALEQAGDDPRQQYSRFLGVWILEKEFDPRLDRAVRQWAQRSKDVRERFDAVDQERIAMLTSIYLAFGYDSVEATMRARITYYHQNGYYAQDVKEPQSQRIALGHYYARVLTGFDFLSNLDQEELHRAYSGSYSFKQPWINPTSSTK